MNIGMFLIPVSALLMACGNLLGNEIISGMSNITLMMICLLYTSVALEVHAHGSYHVQFFFELPLAEPVFVAQSAPYIRIVVNRAESLLVAHVPQRSIVARVHGGSVFHKRRNLCRCHTATCKNNGQQTDRKTHYGK